MQPVSPFWLILATSGMALVPVFLGLVTSYVKVSVVLSMVRNALGTQQVPGTLVIMGLSFALTLFIMGPVFEKSLALTDDKKFKAIVHEQPTMQTLGLIAELFEPWREWVQLHTQGRELQLLIELDARRGTSETSSVSVSSSPPLRILMPAFVLSELRQAFTMAFMVLLPFLVIDLIVANVLVGMGMFMMSPVLVSLPIKLLIFVLSDAWLVIVRGLVLSYG